MISEVLLQGLQVKAISPFSNDEMSRRQNDVRGWIARNDLDASLITSYRCINYYSGWPYCYFGRKYGIVITQDAATTISAGIDGGQSWRRCFGDNINYTDWRRDSFTHNNASGTTSFMREEYPTVMEGKEAEGCAPK